MTDTLVHGCGPVKIIAIHGIQGTNRVWLALAERLSSHCTFILPNLPGRGNGTPYTQADMTLASFADVIENTVKQYINDDEPYCLAGWSMGVSVALKFVARRRVARPQKLMLLSGVPDIGKVSWFAQRTESALLNEIGEREQRLNLLAAAEHRAVMWTWQAIANTSLAQECASVTMPCLILTGEKDEDSPLAQVSSFRRLIPGSALRTIANAGHSILTENTETVSTELAEFLNLE